MFVKWWVAGVCGLVLGGCGNAAGEVISGIAAQEAVCLSIPAPAENTCVSSPFFANGNLIELGPVSKVGTATTVTVSVDTRFVVKRLNDDADAEVYARMCAERAVHTTMGDFSGFSVKMHPIDSGQMPPGCAARLLVLDNAGEFDLWELGPWLTDTNLAEIAAKCIRMLKNLHAFGIVHGDIHAWNIVTSSRADPAGGVRLIDFGLAEPFVDANGRHLPQRRVAQRGVKNPDWLSPLEIEGLSKSRRDDMYRLSEMLLQLRRREQIGRGLDLSREIAARKRETPAGREAILTRFHQAMVALDFSEEPEYTYWQDVFVQAARDGRL